MQKINVLPQKIADMIAAGEVVERPASVVKELAENAVDAGAAHVSIEILGGGLGSIRVTDDGCGMTRKDAQTAFLRHATSKLRTASDLDAITTLGFRGEALAATAAVSRIELLTKTADDAIGTSVRIEGGTQLSAEDAGCPDGTTICVRNLFYNTPARMKFMKRDTTEASNVLAVVQRMALSSPNVAFSYRSEGREELYTAGDGDLAATVYSVLGREFSRSLLPVRGKYESVTVSGFSTKASATRGSRSHQIFFVNGRFVKSKLLTAALEEAYRNRMMIGRFPGCVLYLTLPEKELDVNVHPAKTEVRFLSEQTVFDAVRFAVSAALQSLPDRPEVRLSAPEKGETKTQTKPTANPDFFRTMSASDYRKLSGEMHRDTGIRPAQAVTRDALSSVSSEKTVTMREPILLPKELDYVYPEAKSSPAPAAPAEPSAVQVSLLPEEGKDAPYAVIGEVLDAYIVVEQARTVYFIDKHAAHERILFEKLKAQKHEIASQVLLQPVTVSLSPEEVAAVTEQAELLLRCGFDVAEFGTGTVLVRQIPADLGAEQASVSVSALASDLVEGKRLDPEALRDGVLHTVACKAAIKAGWHTSGEELEKLVREVMTRDDLKHCPHGRPICIALSERTLEKQFKRA